MNAQSGTLSWRPLVDLLQQHHHVVLTSHVRPDCDALGSELALAAALEQLGKQSVRIVNADPTPERLRFMDPRGRIEVLGRDVQAEQLADPKILVVLDTSAWRQLGAMGEVIRGGQHEVVVIDHHASESEVPALVIKDSRYEATGRLIYELLGELEIPLTKEIATALFAAIATDTGWFRFPATTSETYQVIGRLVAAGAAPHEIFQQLYERESLNRAKLRSLALGRLDVECKGRLAHTHLRAEDFAATGAVPSETEDFVNMGLAIDGTQVAVMLTEQPHGVVKVSFRSRSNFDCSQVAGKFGGGGHTAAAGATIDGALPGVQSHVLEEVRRAMGDEGAR